jgi:5-methylcytosine-specific restriction endonuclease McrA
MSFGGIKFKQGGNIHHLKPQDVFSAYLALKFPIGGHAKQLNEKFNISSGAKTVFREALLSVKPKCTYCTKTLTLKSATLDHIRPKSRGGSNARTNLTLACRKCNNKKGNKYPKALHEKPPSLAAPVQDPQGDPTPSLVA